MISKIKQLRFPDNAIVFPDGSNWSTNLVNDLGLVKQLGIYALPGTKFKISQQHNKDEDAIVLIINGSGIFNINVENHPINSIQLCKQSYSLKNQLISIDLVYEEE